MSIKGQEMLKLLPSYYAMSTIMQAIMQAEGSEMDGLYLTLGGILSQFYVNSATWGLDLWEKMLGIPTVPDKPYDQRRAHIISRIRGVGAINEALLFSVAQSYVHGDIDVIDNPATYTLTVKFNDVRGIPPNLADLQAVIETIKPAHLALIYEFTYTLVGDLIDWGTTVGGLIAGGVTVEQLMTWQEV